MKNNTLLNNSIEVLKKIRLELHDDIDSSKRRQLDEAIRNLEDNGSELTKSQVLNVLGKVVNFLPTILKILNSIKEL